MGQQPSVPTLERRVLGGFRIVLGQQRTIPTLERRVLGEFRKVFEQQRSVPTLERRVLEPRRNGNEHQKNLQKPKEFKDDSDVCIDTWVEVMRLHQEQCNLSDETQACAAILSNLEGTALKCVLAKKEEKRDTADKIFEILLNRFGSGMKGHQAMMRFEKEDNGKTSQSIDSWIILI